MSSDTYTPFPFGVNQSFEESYLGSAKYILEQGHCAGFLCFQCFMSPLRLCGTKACSDCRKNGMGLKRNTLRIQVLAAKYVAEHEEKD